MDNIIDPLSGTVSPNMITSRGWIIDEIEAIGELLAYSSHLMEKLVLLKREYGTSANEILDNKIKETEWLRKAAIDSRRRRLRFLLEHAAGDNPDSEYWCPLKHAIGTITRTTEVYDALDTENKKLYYDELETSYSILAGTLSLYLDLQIPSCWACLTDKLLSENK